MHRGRRDREELQLQGRPSRRRESRSDTRCWREIELRCEALVTWLQLAPCGRERRRWRRRSGELVEDGEGESPVWGDHGDLSVVRVKWGTFHKVEWGVLPTTRPWGWGLYVGIG